MDLMVKIIPETSSYIYTKLNPSFHVGKTWVFEILVLTLKLMFPISVFNSEIDVWNINFKVEKHDYQHHIYASKMTFSTLIQKICAHRVVGSTEDFIFNVAGGNLYATLIFHRIVVKLWVSHYKMVRMHAVASAYLCLSLSLSHYMLSQTKL